MGLDRTNRIRHTAWITACIALTLASPACKKRAPLPGDPSGASGSAHSQGSGGSGANRSVAPSESSESLGSSATSNGTTTSGGAQSLQAQHHGNESQGAAGSNTGGIASGNGTSDSPAAPQAEAVPAVPMEPKCFTVQYERKNKNITEDAASTQKNIIALKHDVFDAGSLCVRVNGVPVRYKYDKNKPTEVMLSASVSPRAKITARYCLEKGSCSDSKCVIPKDEFMEAIGGIESADAGEDAATITGGDTKAKKANRKIASYGDWTGGAGGKDVTTSLDADLKRELADMDDPSIKFTLNRDWDVSNEQSSCLKPVGTHAKR